MGGRGSGWYGRPTLFEGTYKIFSFEKDGVPFYFGVTKTFVCKVKSFYIYRSKHRKSDTMNNKVYDFIQSINYNFDVKQLELLLGYSKKDARLLLQEKYLNCKNENVFNKIDYCYCPKESLNPRMPEEVRKGILEDYVNGMKTRDIAKKYGIENQRRINSLVKTNGVNKKELFKLAVEDYKSGMDFWQVVGKYHLLKHMQEKLIKFNDNIQSN